MELQELKVRTRTEHGTNESRRSRRDGDVPGVLYGGGADAVSLRVNARDFLHLIHGRQGEHAVVQVQVEDNPALNTPAMLKSVQHHPVKGHAVHFDLQRIRLDEKITTIVSISLVGRPKGVIAGGVLDYQHREVEVECLAHLVPDTIEVDVSGLEVGSSIHVSQIVPPNGVTIVTDGERTVAAVIPSRLSQTAEAETGEGEGGAEGASS